MNQATTRINGLVLAAGMSSRMQCFKPLMPIQGKTMIEVTVDQLLAAGVQYVVVVLGNRADEVRQSLLCNPERRERLIFAENPLYESTQMLESVKYGIQVMPPCERFFLVPGDMPAISLHTYLTLLNGAVCAPHKVIFPTVQGYRKHPPLIHSSCMDINGERCHMTIARNTTIISLMFVPSRNPTTFLMLS